MNKELKEQSDIFICKLGNGGYWAYPSPFVAHGKGFRLQFRNLTGDDIEIDLREMFVADPLRLVPGGWGSVTLGGKVGPGLYEYRATVRQAGSGTARRRGRATVKPIEVQGGSPPKVIVDI